MKGELVASLELPFIPQVSGGAVQIRHISGDWFGNPGRNPTMADYITYAGKMFRVVQLELLSLEGILEEQWSEIHLNDRVSFGAVQFCAFDALVQSPAVVTLECYRSGPNHPQLLIRSSTGVEDAGVVGGLSQGIRNVLTSDALRYTIATEFESKCSLLPFEGELDMYCDVEAGDLPIEATLQILLPGALVPSGPKGDVVSFDPSALLGMFAIPSELKDEINAIMTVIVGHFGLTVNEIVDKPIVDDIEEKIGGETNEG